MLRSSPAFTQGNRPESPNREERAIAPRRRAASPTRFYYGWVILALSTLCIFFAAGTRSLYAVFYVAQVQEFGWSRGGGSAAYAVNLLFMVGGTPLLGALLDRWGPRWMFGGSLLMTAAGLALGIWVREPWHLAITFGVIAAVGFTANATPLHGLVLARWFSRRRGFAMGVASTGLGAAQAVLSPLVQLIISLWGWRAAYLILALLVALLVPLLALLFRPDPASVGQKVDGLLSSRVITARRRQNRPVRVMEIRNAAWAETDWTLRSALATRAFWGVMGVSLFQSYTLHVIGVHTVALLVDTGFSTATAANLYGAVGFGMTAGLFLWGSVSDRMGREMAYTLGTLFCLAGVASLGFLHPQMPGAIPWAAALLLGLGIGSRPTLFALIAVDIFQGRQMGRIMGIMVAGIGVGGSIGSVSAGLIHDWTGSYAGALWACALTLALSAVCAWVAAPSRIRRPILRSQEESRGPLVFPEWNS